MNSERITKSLIFFEDEGRYGPKIQIFCEAPSKIARSGGQSLSTTASIFRVISSKDKFHSSFFVVRGEIHLG